MSEPDPKSPCISICVLDDEEICQGCFRSASEITDWFMASSADKCAILEAARKRLNASFTVRLK